MKIFKRTLSLVLGASLLASSALAAEMKVSYGENDAITVTGADMPQASVVITVAPAFDGEYTINTPFAAVKEIMPGLDGNFTFKAKFPKSSGSGYYEAAVYNADFGELKEKFFYVSESEAGSILSELGTEKINSSFLSTNAGILGIESDLAIADSTKLVKYLNQFKNGKALDADGFAKVYLEALLIGAMDYTFDEFTDTIENNAFILDIADHEFMSMDASEQEELFDKFSEYDFSSVNFGDALTEAALLSDINSAETKDALKKAIFTDYKDFLNLDTRDYYKLKSPEKVITKLMSDTYTSAEKFEEAFYDAVSEQKKAENKGGSGTGSNNSGSTSASGSYSGNITPPAENKPDDKPQTDVPSSSFTDMTNHWAKAPVEYLKAKGIIDGVGNNKFDPERIVTRAEFAKMIAEALFKNASASDVSFVDVSSSDWFGKYVAVLSELGIITGVGDNNFAPYNTITRQDAAVIISRAAKAGSISLDKIRDSKDFADSTLIADYAKDAVAVLYSAGLVNGVSDSSFEPLSGVTRAQAAQLIYNILTK